MNVCRDLAQQAGVDGRALDHALCWPILDKRALQALGVTLAPDVHVLILGRLTRCSSTLVVAQTTPRTARSISIRCRSGVAGRKAVRVADSTASSSNDPANQHAVTLTPHDTLICRP